MERERQDVAAERWAKVRTVLSAVIATALAVWLASTWIARHTDPVDAITVGPARALLTEAYRGPVPVPGAEHIALVAVGPQTSGGAGGSARWNGVSGRISFGQDALVAVDRRARHDGQLVVWCPETDRWEHPDGLHTYLRGGVRVSGPDHRWLGNLVLQVDATDLIVRPGERLEAGPEATDQDWRAVAPRCVDPTGP